MEDKERDIQLKISTTGLRDWTGEKAKHYNRAESTPYKALDELFEHYQVDDHDVMVDFGAGRGRTSFYVNDRFGIPVTGVELHEQTFDELIINEQHYLKGKSLQFSNIYFEFGYAQKYQIRPEENIFYFFNPFSTAIFRSVIKNIVKSLENVPRPADVILYYPEDDFQQYMENQTPFRRIQTIRLPWEDQNKKKFIVYHYEPTLDE